MSYETVDNVKYFLQNNEFYIVGDNSSTDANGITDQSYEGEITIPEKIKYKEIREIGQYSFRYCKKITKVTIFAKLTAINDYAFDLCTNLKYINIPQTCTFLGDVAISPSSSSNVPLVVEFCKGRTKKIYICENAISFCPYISVIYPSDIEPLYDSRQFDDVTSATICAHSSFSFCGKNMTTTDMSKCPIPIFESYKSAAAAGFTCKRIRRNNIPLISLLLIAAFVPLVPYIAIEKESDKKKEWIKTNSIITCFLYKKSIFGPYIWYLCSNQKDNEQ